MNPILEEIISVLTEMKVPVAENVFLQVPKKPYVTWIDAEDDAEGADDLALYWVKTYTVYFHYKDQRNRTEARKIEKPVEDILRQLGSFKRFTKISYDMEEILIGYSFTVNEDFEDDETEE